MGVFLPIELFSSVFGRERERGKLDVSTSGPCRSSCSSSPLGAPFLCSISLSERNPKEKERSRKCETPATAPAQMLPQRVPPPQGIAVDLPPPQLREAGRPPTTAAVESVRWGAPCTTRRESAMIEEGPNKKSRRPAASPSSSDAPLPAPHRGEKRRERRWHRGWQKTKSTTLQGHPAVYTRGSSLNSCKNSP